MQPKYGLAAETIAAVLISYAAKGQSLAQAVLCGSPNFVEWQHYPRNDHVDVKSGYEFYYHAHSIDQIGFEEHGHFHIFKRDLYDQSQFTHLIGISLDQKGMPVRIFTTNRWVTGEKFQWADRVLQYVHDFELKASGRISPVARWLSAFIVLFEKDIMDVVLARDLRLAALSEQLSLKTVLNMKEHHILTQCNINLMDRLDNHRVFFNE